MNGKSLFILSIIVAVVVIIAIVIFLNKDKFLKENVNCVGEWIAEDCDGTCDRKKSFAIGTIKKKYKITTPVQNNGIKCKNSNGDVLITSCKITDCLVDCVGQWTPWDNCDAICDDISENTGIRTRTYKIITPAQNNGTKCANSNDYIQKELCNKTDCYSSYYNDLDCKCPLGYQSDSDKKLCIHPYVKSNIIDCSNNFYMCNNRNCPDKIYPISAGSNKSLFLKNKKVFICGDRINYKQGQTIGTIQKNKPTEVYIDNIIQLSSGFYCLLYLSNNGKVYTDSDRFEIYNQLSYVVRPYLIISFYEITNISDVKEVSAGTYHSLFLKKDGTVFSCGQNSYGQLGINVSHISTNLEELKIMHQVKDSKNNFIKDIVQVSAGHTHSLFLKNDGTVFICGTYNINTKSDSLIQVRDSSNNFIKDIIQVSAGNNNSLFLKNDGTVWGFGENKNGELGTGNTLVQNTLIQVKDAYNIIQVSINPLGTHSLFLRKDGNIFGCGQNTNGELGTDDDNNKLSLTQVIIKGINNNRNIYGISYISAGRNYSLFYRESDESVFSCGYNYEGKLGTGDNINRLSLVQVI
jgi:alpha-tubulin suppressor-like RCC1 family protein